MAILDTVKHLLRLKAPGHASAIALPPSQLGEVYDAEFGADGKKPIVFQKPYTELMYRAEVSGWTPNRVTSAAASAEAGNFTMLSDLIETLMQDDRVDGVLSTRTHGLLGMPMSFNGGSDPAKADLEGKPDRPGSWWEQHEEAELVTLMKWGITMGIGLAQRIPIPRAPGQMQRYRLETWSPRWLQYQWSATQGTHWFVQTTEGRVPIYQNGGEWVLFTPYGRRRPWDAGKWRSLVFPWLLKRYSLEDRANFSQVLGSPIWMGKAGAGSTEKQRNLFLSQLVNLGKNGKLVLPEGWDLQMKEAASKSWEIFTEQVTWADKAITVVLAGQLVTTEGTSGFSTGNVHDEIKDDLIRFDARRLEECLRTQCLEPWARYNFGDPEAAPWPKWQTERPEDLSTKADMLTKAGEAIKQLDEALGPHALRVDVGAMCEQFDIPFEKVQADKVVVQIPLAPTDVALTVKVNEVRASSGLGALQLPDGSPDPRGDMLIGDLKTAADKASALGPLASPTPSPAAGAPPSAAGDVGAQP